SSCPTFGAGRGCGERRAGAGPLGGTARNLIAARQSQHCLATPRSGLGFFDATGLTPCRIGHPGGSSLIRSHPPVAFLRDATAAAGRAHRRLPWRTRRRARRRQSRGARRAVSFSPVGGPSQGLPANGGGGSLRCKAPVGGAATRFRRTVMSAFICNLSH